MGRGRPNIEGAYGWETEYLGRMVHGDGTVGPEAGEAREQEERSLLAAGSLAVEDGTGTPSGAEEGPDRMVGAS